MALLEIQLENRTGGNQTLLKALGHKSGYRQNRKIFADDKTTLENFPKM